MARQQSRTHQRRSSSGRRRSVRDDARPSPRQGARSSGTTEAIPRPLSRPVRQDSGDPYHDSVIRVFRELDVRLDSVIARTLLRDGLADCNRFPTVRIFVSSLSGSRIDAVLFYVRTEVINLLASIWIRQDWRSFSFDRLVDVRRSLIERVASHLGIP